MHRRAALQHAACAAALFGMPAPAQQPRTPPLPAAELYRKDPEAYWARLRTEQFLLPEWRAFLNTGSLGIAARPVLEAVTDSLSRAAGWLDDEYPRWGYETLDALRRELADFLGCRKDELALTHNATEAMNIVANGLDLASGDEVLITDQEHPGGSCCWLQKQARFAIVVREAKLPIPPQSPSQLADALLSSIGPRTRVLSFSGITTRTGLVLPVAEICAEARRRGVLTVVDGAHMNGQVSVRLGELGCDFYAGSPHKWLFTPAGCGILYGRPEMLDRLWVNVATSGWNNKELKAARFQMVGTNNLAIFEGFLAAVRFLKALGPERVHSRIHQLAQLVRRRALELPAVEMLTPEDDRLYGGLVSFRIRNTDLKPVFTLARKRRIWLLEADKFRIATHIHTRLADLDAFFETVHDALAQIARNAAPRPNTIQRSSTAARVGLS